ncbi:MAG TPA: hypothetical protein VNO26_06760 [Candidatus Limnocylindria bacterium]|nr:hypothetical protein [Candidatus Limnocylindria bacterium]
MTPALARIVGFVVLVHGLGLRLDSTWQGTAWLVILSGGALLAWWLARQASVSDNRER